MVLGPQLRRNLAQYRPRSWTLQRLGAYPGQILQLRLRTRFVFWPSRQVFSWSMVWAVRCLHYFKCSRFKLESGVDAIFDRSQPICTQLSFWYQRTRFRTRFTRRPFARAHRFWSLCFWWCWPHVAANLVRRLGHKWPLRLQFFFEFKYAY